MSAHAQAEPMRARTIIAIVAFVIVGAASVPLAMFATGIASPRATAPPRQPTYRESVASIAADAQRLLSAIDGMSIADFSVAAEGIHDQKGALDALCTQADLSRPSYRACRELITKLGSIAGCWSLALSERNGDEYQSDLRGLVADAKAANARLFAAMEKEP